MKKRIIVRDGQIFSSWSNDPRESLGQFLIRESMVTEEQLFKALIGQEEKGRLIGSILVSEGILTEDDLRLALQAKAVETIYDLFLWPEGEFDFREGEFPYDVLIHWETPVTPVILEGIRRVDEWNRIRAVFPSMEVTFKVLGAPDDLEVAPRAAGRGPGRAGQDPGPDRPGAAPQRLRHRPPDVRPLPARAWSRWTRSGRTRRPRTPSGPSRTS